MIKHLIIFIILLASSLLVFAQEDFAEIHEDNTDRIEELEERLDVVETTTLIDKFSFSSDIRITMNNYFFKDNKVKGENIGAGYLNHSGQNLGVWNMRARLKGLARLGRTLKFTMWMMTFKNFSNSKPDFDTRGDHPSYDGSRSYYPTNGTIFMERAFIDWFIADWLVFSLGRAPTVDGRPSNIQNNSVRLGTFSSYFINMPSDSFYLTFYLNKLGLKNSYLRVGYVPRVFMDEFDGNIISASEQGLQNYSVIQLDMAIPGIDGGALEILATYTGDPKSHSWKVGDIAMDALPKTLGKYFFFGGSLVFENLLESGLDLYGGFASTLMVPAKRNPDDPNNGVLGTTIDGEIKPIAAMGGAPDGKARWGYMYTAGFRYALPIEVNENPIRFGTDFNVGTKWYNFFYVPDTTMTTRYNTKGYYVESYFQIPVYRRSHIKLGYYYQHSDWVTGLIFPIRADKGIAKLDENLHNAYLMFNFYF